MNLGERYKKLRQKLSDNNGNVISIKELSEKICIAAPRISELENNKREMSLTELKAYHTFFNVSFEYLLGETNVKSTKEDIKSIGKFTGLDEKAIAIIKSMKNFGSICYENTEVSGENAFEALNEYLSNMICEKVSVYLADMKIANADFLIHCLIKRIYEDDRHKCNESGKIPTNMACFDYEKLSDDIKEKSEKCDMGYFRTSKIYEEFLKQYQCNTIGEYYDIKDIYERLYDTFGYTKEQVDEKIKEIWKKYDEVGYKQWQP